MPLFKSKKQPKQAARRRNIAAEHNARAGAVPARQPLPEKPALAVTPASSEPVPDKRLEKILKSRQNILMPDEPSRQERRDKFDWKIRWPDLRKSVRAAQNLYKVLSVAVDIGVLILILILAVSLTDLRDTVNGIISDLYKSFVTMDNATIATKIEINDAPIPLDFNLPVVQEETYVTLTQDVTIKNAKVGVLSLATTVTLPAGTVLPVSLNMNVPVKTTLLVDMEVPVQIDLAKANPLPPQVSLHQGFIGLQNALGPYYCLFQKGQDPDCPNGTYHFKTP